jgi:hypothetical protein
MRHLRTRALEPLTVLSGTVAFCGKYDTGIIRAVNISRRRGRG